MHALESTQQQVLGRLPQPANGRMRTEDLGVPLLARQLAAGAASSTTELTPTCRRISIHARLGNIRFQIGSSDSVTASGASHYIAQGERLDLALPATPYIAVIRADGVNAVLELMELGEPN